MLMWFFKIVFTWAQKKKTYQRLDITPVEFIHEVKSSCTKPSKLCYGVM